MGNLKSPRTLNVPWCLQPEKKPESLGDPPSKSWFPRFSSWLSPQSCSSSIDMLPASFTSFSSLKELSLSYAGLSEATSSMDLGSLSFLEDLDLSGNEFFSLPSGISRLSKLQCLRVERCRNLLSISELPSSVLSLSINDCTSIERVSAPLQHERLPFLNVEGCRNLIEIQGMECSGNNWSILNLNGCNNLSENNKMSLVQGLCKGKHYDICLAGGEIPEWFSHRGEGSALSFLLPSVPVPVPDGNKLQALLFWVVSASTNEATLETSLPRFDMCLATFKNKSNGIELFETMAAVTFDRTITKQSWIQRIPLIGLEESLQGVEELEVNVKISLYDVRKCWVEKCGVHLIMEKNKADSDQQIDIHALGSDDQWLASRLIRELQKWKITSCSKFGQHKT